MSTVSKVKNPLTGRMIVKGGDTYNRLIATGYQLVNDNLLKVSDFQESTYSPKIIQESSKITGSIPSLGDFQQELNQIIKEEDEKRSRLCGVCKDFYLDRWMPFTTKEFSNLRKIISACDECAKLCDTKYYRQQKINAPECLPYKAAVISGRKQESKIQADLIRAGLAAGKDVSNLFPAIPENL